MLQVLGFWGAGPGRLGFKVGALNVRLGFRFGVWGLG